MSEPVRYVYVERPRGHGCLWSCLGVLLLLSLPFIFAGGYSAWFLWPSRESPGMRAAIAMIERDSLAQQVLGRPITVIGVQGSASHFVLGRGARNSYLLHLRGPRGDGYLDVTSHVEHAQTRIDTMKLTGPDGQEYDLLHHAPLPPSDGDTKAI